MTMVQEKTPDTVREDVRAVAKRLAEGNVETSPDIQAIYWFRDDEMVRLVMIDPVTLPSEQMVPFYFGPYPLDDIPYPYAVVLIRPEEEGILASPPGWGGWLDAVRLWPK